jgi:hypothetical protein
MKKLLIVALISFLPGCLFSQTKNEFTKNSPNFRIIDNSKGNRLAFIGFDEIEEHKADASPGLRQIEKSSVYCSAKTEPVTIFHLTIQFSQTMNTEGSWVFITSNSHLFSRVDMDFSPDGLIGEIDVPANTYEILSMYDMYSDSYDVIPKYVITHSFTIESDTTLEVNFESMANHTVFLPMTDENGVEINRLDANMLHNALTIDIEFPAGNTISASINQISVPNGCIKVSDVEPGYKIILNQLMILNGSMYIADMGMLENLYLDTTLQNSYTDYKKMKIVFHNTPQNTGTNHLNFGYGTNYYDNGQYYFVQGHSFGNDGAYPVQDNDTLQVFMDNKQIEVINNDLLTCIATVSYVDETDKSVQSSPFFVNSNDSIAFATFNVTAVNPQFGTNSIVDFGNNLPFYRIYFYNDLNNITALSLSVGDKLEERKIDHYFNVLEISNNDDLLLFDYLSNFEGSLNIVEPGQCAFNIINTNYVVYGQTGEYHIDNTFDTSIDPVPPAISSFKIVNGEGISTNQLNNDDTGLVVFSAYDLQSNYISAPLSAKMWYKKYEDEEWTEISVIEFPDLFDYISFGSVYKGDLTSVINQFENSGFLDLKVVITDNSGNESAHTWHPAAYIDKQVGTNNYDILTEPALIIYPNPVNAIINLSYEGKTPYRVKILDLTGKEIYKSPELFSSSHNLDCSAMNLKNGVYFIQLINDNDFETKKFLYKH